MNGQEQGVTPESEDDESEGMTFAMAIPLFPASERTTAEECAEILEAAIGQRDQLLKTYNLMIEFDRKMQEKYGSDVVTRVKLHHLISGSGVSKRDWRAYTLDTPGGEFEAFIKNELARIANPK